MNLLIVKHYLTDFNKLLEQFSLHAYLTMTTSLIDEQSFDKTFTQNVICTCEIYHDLFLGVNIASMDDIVNISGPFQAYQNAIWIKNFTNHLSSDKHTFVNIFTPILLCTCDIYRDIFFDVHIINMDDIVIFSEPFWAYQNALQIKNFTTYRSTDEQSFDKTFTQNLLCTCGICRDHSLDVHMDDIVIFSGPFWGISECPLD